VAQKTEYIVMTAAAKMPQSCWGVYRRVAVVEVEKGARPKMISERAIGVVRVSAIWERLNVGKTERCAYAQALKDAEQLCAKLNKKQAEK
jgi:hypothetical protein